MGYSGAVASEDSSGERTRRGGITKTGNAHLRRIVIEAAWAYRHRPAVGAALRKRQATVSAEVKAIAWKAQHRLHAPLPRTHGRGKCQQQVVTAVGRELLGFIWAIGVTRGIAQRRADSRSRRNGTSESSGTQQRWWSRGTRNGESSTNLCGGPPGSTRALSPRQLPTDHDYAVPTREYQSDQPSR